MSTVSVFDMDNYEVSLLPPTTSTIFTVSTKITGWAKGNCFTLEKADDEYTEEEGSDGYLNVTSKNSKLYKISMKLVRHAPANKLLQQLMSGFKKNKKPQFQLMVVDNNNGETVNILSPSIAYIKKRPVESVGNDGTPAYDWSIMAHGGESAFPFLTLSFNI
jgi:hypothetical protein